MLNRYTQTGFSLFITGVLLFLAAYLVLKIMWLSAFGIAMLILALITFALGRSIPRLSPEVCRVLLETGTDNIAAIVEELGIRSKAVYLPSSLAGGQPKAFLPLHSNPGLPRITRALPRRLITHYGTEPEDVGLLISTVGTTACGLLESKPDNPTELESALTTLFSGTLGIADRARVYFIENRIKVVVYNARLESKASWSDQCLGKPLSSIAAAVTAEVLRKPVIIQREELGKNKHSVELEVIGEGI